MPLDTYPIKLYLRHLPNRIMLLSSVMANLLIWGWLAWNIRPQESAIFLHYNVLFGVDLIGPWQRVFYVPLAGLSIILVNAFIGWFLFSKDKFAAHVLNGAALLSQIFLIVVAALLVFLNV